MHKFYKKHIIADRLNQVARYQGRIDYELDALATSLDTDVLEVLLEIQNELGYKWSFFSGLMHTSLAFYVCGIANINPLIFKFDFDLYCNQELNYQPKIFIDLPPGIELSEFNNIAETYGYSIIKEDRSELETNTDIYHFLKLIKPKSRRTYKKDQPLKSDNKQVDWELKKTEVFVFRSKIVHTVNRAFSGFLKPYVALKFMRIEPDDNENWEKIARGSILKYFDDLPIDMIDYYFDHDVNNFFKLASFIVVCNMKNEEQLERNVKKDGNDNMKSSKEVKSKEAMKQMVNKVFDFLSIIMSKSYKQAYELFVLNYLEHCYPKEFRKGMGNNSLAQSKNKLV